MRIYFDANLIEAPFSLVQISSAPSSTGPPTAICAARGRAMAIEHPPGARGHPINGPFHMPLNS